RNGTYSYLDAMNGDTKYDPPSALETELMFNSDEMKFVMNTFLGNPINETNYRQMGQAALLMLGHYEFPKSDFFINDVKNQLMSWFGFSKEQAFHVAEDYKSIRDANASINLGTSYRSVNYLDTRNMPAELLGFAIAYSQSGDNKPSIDVFKEVKSTLENKNYDQNDIRRAVSFINDVHRYSNHDKKPKGFRDNQKKLAVINRKTNNHPDKKLEGIAREFNDDIRLYLEHMNPMENFFVVVDENVNQTRLEKELNKVKLGNYDRFRTKDEEYSSMDMDALLKEVNQKVGGGVLSIMRVTTPKNVELYRTFMELQHNDGTIDNEEKKVLSNLATVNPDINKSRLKRLKIHALATDPSRAVYHRMFAQMASEYAKDGAYTLAEQYEVKLATKALTELKILPKSLAAYEEAKIVQSCGIIGELNPEEKVHIDRFLDSLADFIFYGYRVGPGSEQSNINITQNLLDYMYLHFNKNLGEKVKGTFLLEINRKLDEGKQSLLSHIITEYRSQNGMPIELPKGAIMSVEARDKTDLSVRMSEHMMMTEAYNAVNDLAVMDRGRLFGNLPGLDEIMTVIQTKEHLDQYDSIIFETRLAQIKESPLNNDCPQEDADWKNKFHVIAHYLVRETSASFRKRNNGRYDPKEHAQYILDQANAEIREKFPDNSNGGSGSDGDDGIKLDGSDFF
ncbi:MAG: hypothetical protein KKE20_02945, partial [Nanoarchaeota archaeon]|nr:hypothetical protein [Nanoarchaeota archaeon]